jgi:hypothetical protein
MRPPKSPEQRAQEREAAEEIRRKRAAEAEERKKWQQEEKKLAEEKKKKADDLLARIEAQQKANRAAAQKADAEARAKKEAEAAKVREVEAAKLRKQREAEEAARPRVSRDTYNQVRIGMSYNDVRRIFNSNGKENSRAGNATVVTWQSDALFPTIVTITFIDGEVFAKAIAP